MYHEHKDYATSYCCKVYRLAFPIICSIYKFLSYNIQKISSYSSKY